MSIRGKSPPAATEAVAAEFWARFVKDAHRLIAEGFARLDASTLASEGEEVISARIVEGIEQWYDDAIREPWMALYFVDSEGHQFTAGRAGKHAPRIDIQIATHQTHEARGRPARMLFEAKRIYRTDSVAEYLGKDGLQQFLNGTYGSNARSAAMLAYIQASTYENAKDRIETKLDKERAVHCLPAEGDVWRSDVQDTRLPTTMRSRHVRNGPGLLDVYHSFLKCF